MQVPLRHRKKRSRPRQPYRSKVSAQFSEYAEKDAHCIPLDQIQAWADRKRCQSREK